MKKVLDLHGIKHSNVNKVLDDFIWECISNNVTQATIITGNSSTMKSIAIQVIGEYGLEPSNYWNFSSYFDIDFI